MKFYDREAELEILHRNRTMSKRNSVFTVITGRRRMGKTALIKESEKDGKFLYFFVTRGSEVLLCEQLAENAQRDLGITLINSGRFRDLFMQLMRYGEENDFTFVIDEFQDLERVNRSITSSIQNHWDEYKSKSKVNLIVCGSVYSMMIKIFRNNKEPLFGRATSRLSLGPFRPSVVKTILKDHNPNYTKDDLLFLYMVTGGVPKYIETLMDMGATTFDKMLNAVCTQDSIFLTDGEDILISEFGKEYGTYLSILELIASGKNTLGEIDNSTGKESGAYLENLEKKYGLIKRSKPLFSKDGGRGVRWQISDNYLRFYFRFICGNRSMIELKSFDHLKKIIADEYAQYSGTVLEDYFREKMIEEEDLTNIGSYWDRKGQNEIDVIAVNDTDMKAIVADVKRDPKKVNLPELKKKVETVPGLNGYEIEYRGLSLNDM